MTQPAGETGQSAGQGGQSATGTEGNSTTNTSGTGAQGGAGETANTAPATVTREEFEQIKRQLQAADQNRAKAEAEAKALKDAQLSAEEKTKQDLKEAQDALAKREQDLRNAKIQNAFLTDNTYQWHDPKAALKLADLSAIKVEGDKVEGLKEALKAVADAFPFMVKPKEENNSGSNDNSASNAGAAGVGGTGAAASRAGSTNQAELARRFPALRGRVS